VSKQVSTIPPEATTLKAFKFNRRWRFRACYLLVSNTAQSEERQLPNELLHIVSPSKVDSLTKKDFSNLAKHIQLQLMGYIASNCADSSSDLIKQLAKDRTVLIPRRNSRTYEK